MTVTVRDHHTGKVREYRGSHKKIAGEVAKDFPHVAAHDTDLGPMLDEIEAMQNYSVAVADVDEHDDDEVRRLLQHPNPAERAMALKLEGSTLEHALEALSDQHPAVREAALRHHQLNSERLLDLMRQPGAGRYQLIALRDQDVPLDHVHLAALARTIAEHPSPEFEELTAELARRGMGEQLQKAEPPGMKTWRPDDLEGSMRVARGYHENVGFEYIPIGQLAHSPDCRVHGMKDDCREKHEPTREGANRYVQKLAKLLRARGGFPPVEVYRDPAAPRLNIEDGNHRIAAARDLGFTHVPALVFGPPDDSMEKTAPYPHAARSIPHEILPAIFEEDDGGSPEEHVDIDPRTVSAEWMRR